MFSTMLRISSDTIISPAGCCYGILGANHFNPCIVITKLVTAGVDTVRSSAHLKVTGNCVGHVQSDVADVTSSLKKSLFQPFGARLF